MKKQESKILSVIVTLFLCLSVNAQSVTITEAGGWLESAYVKWLPVANATKYNVYYSGQGITSQQVDDYLIRSYGTYYRADIPGLKAGEYTVKIVPVVGGAETTAAVTSALTVKAHDRTGFAFTNGRIPGAYQADGTAKAGAVILYITENNKNTVSLTVTGASANPCVGLQAILDGFKKGKDTRPLIVRLIGQITDLSYMYSGDIVVENANNAASAITIEGVGDDAVADGWGIRIKSATNIEIRNIGLMNCNSDEGDNIGLQQDNDYVWVHHCDLFYGEAGSDADQIKGDGALDCKKSTYVTFSYNHFWDSGKCNLLGLSEGTTNGLYISYHHNWYDHSDSRHPRVRYYSAHVYNNYYDGNSKYGAGACLGSSVFVESNYFRNCKYPMLTSMQGSDVYNESTQANDYKNMPTFSSEDGGSIKAFNNYMSEQKRFVPYGAAGYANSTVDFDAYVATSRSETVPATVKSAYGANSYNNFDTNTSVMYAYTPDSPEAARNNVIAYAGRVKGGDLKWTFNNAVDDASYTVNTALKTALMGYKTSLVAIQAEASGQTGSQTLALTSGSSAQTVTAGSAIADIVYTWGGKATGATVTGLTGSGLSAVTNAAAKTVTIAGIPSASVTYTVTTSGTEGTAATATGTITVGSNTGSGSVIHNFSTDGKTSTFFAIAGNLSTGYGTVSYNTLTLTQCLKMESSTTISFTTTQSSTLTLVFNGAYTGSINIDGTAYNITSTGIITATLAAGTHTITKKSGSTYLFYMSVEYQPTGVGHSPVSAGISIYPNPAGKTLNIDAGGSVVRKVEIFSLSGDRLMVTENTDAPLDISRLPAGNYLVKIACQHGNISQIIVKNKD